MTLPRFGAQRVRARQRSAGTRSIHSRWRHAGCRSKPASHDENRPEMIRNRAVLNGCGKAALHHRCPRLPPIQRSEPLKWRPIPSRSPTASSSPCLNEEAVLPVLLRRLDLLLARLRGPAEAIFVDDGSSDSSPFVLQALAKRDPRFRYIGHVAQFRATKSPSPPAWTRRKARPIVVMDADLQDPPEIVEQLIATMGGRLRRRLCAPSVARRRKPVQARHRHLFYRMLASMSSVGIPGRRRRLPPDRPQGARRAAPEPEQDRFVRGHDRLARFPADRSDFPSPRCAPPVKPSIRCSRWRGSP